MIALALLICARLFGGSEGFATLECLHDKMRLTLDSTQDVDQYSFRGSSGANCAPSASNTVFEVGLDECGTEVDHNSTHIIFENTLTGSEATDSIISRGSMLVLVLKCVYNREGTTEVLSWEAGQAIYNSEEEGSFTFTLKTYDEYSLNNFGPELTAPFSVDLREKMYFSIEMNVPATSTLTIELVHVIAMDSPDVESDTVNKYYIFQDGCAEDATFESLLPTGDNTKRKSFSLEAFNFVSDGSAPVYIHGVVKICDTAEATYDTCSAAAICSARRRRNTELSGHTDREFSVYGGPFLIHSETEKTSSVPHYGGGHILVTLVFMVTSLLFF